MVPMLFINRKLTKTEDVILIKDVEKLDMWYFLRLQVHLNDHIIALL